MPLPIAFHKSIKSLARRLGYVVFHKSELNTHEGCLLIRYKQNEYTPFGKKRLDNPKGIELLKKLLPVGYVLKPKQDIIVQKEGYHYVPDIYGKSANKLSDIREEETFFELANAVYEQQTSCLYFDRLHVLYQAAVNVIRNAPPERRLNFIEVGVYKGGGTYFLASVAERMAKGRVQLFAVDTFSGHDKLDLPNGEEGKHNEQRFTDTTFESVQAYLKEFPNVAVLQGRIQDRAEQLADQSFDLVHLDVDIYLPTLFSLRFFGERLNPGGIIIVDDYNYRTCPGIKQAIDDYLSETPFNFYKVELLSGQCLLISR